MIGFDLCIKKMICIVIFALLLLCPQAYCQVIHENPDTVVPSHGQDVESQVESLLEGMMARLGDISIALDNGNYSEARASYSKFSASFDDLGKLLWQLNMSEADFAAISGEMNLTNDAIRAIIERGEAYNLSIARYNESMLAGDTANASIYAGNARESYVSLSSSYEQLRRNASIVDRILADRGIYTGGLDASLGSLDRYMFTINASYQNVSAVHGPALSLSLDRSRASIGDEVVFRVVLRDENGTPMPGESVRVYVDGRLAGECVTGEAGEGSIIYVVPVNVSGDHIFAHSECALASSPGLLVASGFVELEVEDIAPALTINIDKNAASLGDTVNVTGTLMARGQPMPGRRIALSFSDFSGSAVTDSNGSYNYSMKVGPYTASGSYPVIASYIRKENDILLNASASSGELNVSSMTALLSLNAPGFITPGSVASVSGSLTAGNGVPAADAVISLHADDAFLGNYTTGDDGSYSGMLPVPNNMSPGMHTLYAVFDPGMGRALAPANSTPLSVIFQAGEPRLSMSGVPMVAFRNDTICLNGTLRADSGMPIAGKELEVSIFGGPRMAAITDEGGNFSLSYVVTGEESAGTSSIQVIDPNSSKVLYSGSVLLLPYDMPLIAGAIALIIIAVAGVFGYTRYVAYRPKPQKAAEAPPAPAEASAPAMPEKPSLNIEDEAARIRGLMYSDRRQAMTQAYILLKEVLNSHGIKPDDSMTHNELYRYAAEKLPSASAQLKGVVSLYEKAIYANMPLADAEFEMAMRYIAEIYKTPHAKDESG